MIEQKYKEMAAYNQSLNLFESEESEISEKSASVSATIVKVSKAEMFSSDEPFSVYISALTNSHQTSSPKLFTDLETSKFQIPFLSDF